MDKTTKVSFEKNNAHIENKPKWMVYLDERQIKEIVLARIYADDFNHGTDGHSRLILIARLADILDDMEQDGKEHDPQTD